MSFRGDDDTYKFIEGLSAVLESEEGFGIFGDDKKLETVGSDIPPHLLEAIKQSWVCIVIFSKNYASSVWCLEELSMVAARSHDLVVPVFFDVYSFYYEKAFYEHEERFEADLDKIKTWRRDLKEVANLSGWHVRKDSTSHVIHVVAREVKTKIDHYFYKNLNFVAMQPRVKEVESVLDLGSNDVRVIGIWGMGGTGKTSLARALYDKIFRNFDVCFYANTVNEFWDDNLSLQELLDKSLMEENPMKSNILGKEFLARKRLRHHKCLMVIDDVMKEHILEELNLAEKSKCFGGGSRIIIVTRDRQVLSRYEVDHTFKTGSLNREDCLKLFCSRAFLKGYPVYPVKNFEEMTYRAIDISCGIPLAIAVLGSLFYGKTCEQWERILDRLEIITRPSILNVLEISFGELDNISKAMFLDIACFFPQKEIDCVKEILHDCGFSVERGIKLLVERLLMTISYQRIQIHPLMRQMGRQIVEREDPGMVKNRSRLGFYEDIYHVMESTYEANERVEAIVLDLEKPEEVKLRIEALSHMTNLRLLIFRNVNFTGTLSNLPSRLRYVSWYQYPLAHLPSSFKSDTLAQLIMPDSNITEVWKGKMILPKLRNMNLRGSKKLIRTPDFSGVPNLERLDLGGCIRLLQLHPSIAKLSKLKFLNLRDCINLVSIPNGLFALNSLRILNLTSCSKLAHCLNFSPLRSSIEVKLLLYCPFLEKVTYFLLHVLPRQRKYLALVFCIIYLASIYKV